VKKINTKNYHSGIHITNFVTQIGYTEKKNGRFLRMHLKKICLVLSLVLLIPNSAYSKDYKAKRRSGDLIVEMRINRNPPVVDKNEVTLEIKDINGRRVTDARVHVNYYMPPMPGMPPMNYTRAAQLSGYEYKATMDLIMAGPWNIVVKMIRGGKSSSVTFIIDVR
jgi:hypothetical protein